MYPPKFDYHRASSIEEAVAWLQQHDGAKIIAGGHSLLPAMKLRLAEPPALLDIGRITALKSIAAVDGGWRVGALATHAQIAATVKGQGFEAIAETANGIGDPQVRNRGTIGGNIAHADPASDWPAVLVALGATITVVGPGGQRSIPAQEFFIDLFQTALNDGEIVQHVQLPALNGASNQGVGSAYEKMANPASRYALIGVAAVVKVENGICSQAGVAVGGLTPFATRTPAVEAALVGKALNAETIQAAAALANGELSEVNGDIHASAEYRSALLPTYVARALTTAAARAS